MDTAKLFRTGRSQAVRLPKEYRFEGTEVVVKHFAGGVLLLPMTRASTLMEAALDMFEPGFQLVREQPVTQERPELLP